MWRVVDYFSLLCRDYFYYATTDWHVGSFQYGAIINNACENSFLGVGEGHCAMWLSISSFPEQWLNPVLAVKAPNPNHWTTREFPPSGILVPVFWRTNLCIYVYMHACLVAQSHVWFFVTPWSVVCQTPLSLGSSRQAYWSELPLPPPGDLPDPGIKPGLLHHRRILYHQPPGKLRLCLHSFKHRNSLHEKFRINLFFKQYQQQKPKPRRSDNTGSTFPHSQHQTNWGLC